MNSRTLAAALLATSLVPLSASSVRVFAAVANPYAAADDNPAGFGPLDPTPPSGITVDEIIKRFGQRESEFNAARENYIFRQTVRVQTISEDNGRPDGEYYQVTDITFDKQGKRSEHVVFAPQNTLERVQMTIEDAAVATG